MGRPDLGLIPFLLCFMLIPFVGRAGVSSTNFNGSVGPQPPQVDATNFINTGTWSISTAPLPYQTANTLNYTNTGAGTMDSTIGWEFDFGPTSSGRSWSTSFFNDNNATISALDGSFNIFGNPNATITASYLLVSATNIVNKGQLEAGPFGEIILNGSEVNLSRSFLQITPVVGVGSTDSKTNFTPDIAIYDQFWAGANSNKLTVTGSPWNGTTLSVFNFFNVGLTCGATGTEVIGKSTPPQAVDSHIGNVGQHQLITTNDAGQPNPPITLFSNIVHQGIFVFTSSSNIVATTHFGQMLSATNPFLPMAVQLVTISTNTVTQTPQNNTLYVIDTLAAIGTNGTLLTNSTVFPSAACTTPTERPASVIISRTDSQGIYAGGFPGLGPPSSIFFYDPLTFSNLVATGKADVYSALVDNLAAQAPSGPPAVSSITNAPGKIHIYAKDLDLTKTRISAASEILIQATNLIGSAGAAMDCQNLSYNFGSTNGLLNVVNFAGQNVQRFHGTITEHSDLWTNYMLNVFQNFITNSAATNAPFYTESDITNVTEMDLAITVVDGSGLQTTIPVDVRDLILHSPNMVLSDSMQVSQTLLFDGQGLTIQGGLNLFNALQDWNSTIAPTLRFFTNNGTLQIPNNAHFGDDRIPNYAAFVNHGFISSAGQAINSDYLEINGGTDQTSAGDFTAACQTGLVMNATIDAAGNVQFFANTLQIDPSTVFAEGSLNFTVTNSLSDGGLASSNRLDCENGFNLFIKPATGDLLGTIINDFAFGQDEVDHAWAGHDFGTNAAGYLNNVAIGTLNLAQQSSVFEPLYRYSGANTGNGLYVSNLDLSHLSDYTNEIEIDPNLVIYFAAAKLNTNVVIAPFPSAEAFLDGQFGGHLRWVRNTVITSNTAMISGSMISGGKFQFSVTDSGNSVNQTNIVQVSTNLLNWVPIYTNIGSMMFTDPAANIYPRRFYRVMTLP